MTVEDLAAGYGGRPLIEGWQFSVAPGEAVGIVGKNGVGKSTLLKAIVGELPRLRGRVLLDGRAVPGDLSRMLPLFGIGYLPQYGRNIPNLTVAENLRLCLGLGWADVVRAASRSEGLDSILAQLSSASPNQLAGNLSGGQNVLLSLLCLLLRGCRYLLLDEPSAGVDRENMRLLAGSFSRVKRSGIGFVIVEQDEGFLGAVVDQRLDCGRYQAS